MVAREGAAGLPDVTSTGQRRFSTARQDHRSGLRDVTVRQWCPTTELEVVVDHDPVDNEGFYLDSLDEEGFKEALQELDDTGGNTLVITNAAKKYLAQNTGNDENEGSKTFNPPKSAPGSRRTSRDSSRLQPGTKQKSDFLVAERRSRSAGSSPNAARFPCRDSNPNRKGKSADNSRQPSPRRLKSSRTRLVKRKVKTPDGKRKTEYAFVYDKSVHSLHHDQKWQQETTLGKRVALYKLQGELGRGNFSTVKLGIHELTKERVAVKILDKSKLTPKAKKMIVREIANMEAIHHKNLIRLFEVVETFGKLHLVMEFVAGGELYRKLTTEGKMKEQDAKIAFAQILSGVRHLHERNIIHRDIKAENVFCGPRGIVKLGDFGFSTRVTGIQLAVWGDQLKTFCGSPPYAAPELFRDESYIGRPVDIWALGVLLFFMTTGHMPFPADSIGGLKRTILLGVITAPAHLSLPCRTLIRGILQQDPNDRFSLDQIASAEWMQGLSTTGGACERFVLTPTVGVPSEQLATDEKSARARLEALGITSSMLEQEVVQGARSPIIASYRIVVNRVYSSTQQPYVPPVKSQKSKTCIIL